LRGVGQQRAAPYLDTQCGNSLRVQTRTVTSRLNPEQGLPSTCGRSLFCRFCRIFCPASRQNALFAAHIPRQAARFRRRISRLPVKMADFMAMAQSSGHISPVAASGGHRNCARDCRGAERPRRRAVGHAVRRNSRKARFSAQPKMRPNEILPESYVFVNSLQGEALY
jgi:hypothetical protein